MSDEPTKTDAAAAPAAAPAKSKLPLIAGLVVAGIAAGGAVGVLIAGPALSRKYDAPATTASAAAPAEGGAHGGKEGEAKGSEAVAYAIDNLVLNPAGSGGGRFLLVSVSLRLTSAAAKEALVLRDAEARDAILRVLGTKPVEELIEVVNREKIKKEIAQIVNGMFPGPKAVQGVYFSQFVIQ